MRLQGKVGIITAAASGMGRAGAEIFARKGAAVAIVDRDEQAINQVAEEIKKKGGKTLAISADLRDDTIATGIVDQATSEFEYLDFVWDHLGHPGPATVEGVNMAEYELACDLNMRVQLVTTEAASASPLGRYGQPHEVTNAALF